MTPTQTFLALTLPAIVVLAVSVVLLVRDALNAYRRSDPADEVWAPEGHRLREPVA